MGVRREGEKRWPSPPWKIKIKFKKQLKCTKKNRKTIKMYKKNLTCRRTPSYVMRRNFFTKGKVMSYFFTKKGPHVMR